MLVLEDAHWLDSASTGLVLALSRERLPLLLVVATRSRGEGGTVEDELAWAAYRRLLRAPNLERLVLDRLSVAAVEALVGQRLGAAAVPEVAHPAGRGEGRGQPVVHRGAGLRPARRRPGPGGRRPGRAASDVPDVLARRLPRPSTA